jgi:hypothetical protein
MTWVNIYEEALKESKILDLNIEKKIEGKDFISYAMIALATSSIICSIASIIALSIN